MTLHHWLIQELTRLSCLQCKVYERQSQALKSQSLQQIRSGLRLCSLQKVATLAAVMKRSRAKSREDITPLMHVTYTGEDAVPLQQDTDM